MGTRALRCQPTELAEINPVEEIPPTIGGYRIISKLGEGASGSVYLATSLETRVPIALKVLHAWVGPTERARLRREARIASRLDHPNVVRIHCIGEDRGRMFVVQDLIACGSLKQRVRRAPLSADEAARITERLARALVYTHHHGILHRDIKPANVLLDRAGEPHLTDFGLAKEWLSADASQITRRGTLLGTPSYMSPEQAHGVNVDERTDLYSLGATLYAMLTGTTPFPNRGGGFYRMLIDVASKKPAPLNVDPELDRICLTCLEKNPNDRYPSARALADALARWRAGRRKAAAKLEAPLELVPLPEEEERATRAPSAPSRRKRLRVALRRQRTAQQDILPYGVAFVLALLLSVGVALGLGSSSPPRPAVSDAEAHEQPSPK